MKKWVLLALATLMPALVALAGAETIPLLQVETVATPVRTARMWVSVLSPNPRGNWNFIAQFMNYKYTTGHEFERVKLTTGREYVAFKDRQRRPDAEWLVLDLETGKYRIFDLPGFHGGPACRAGNGRIFFPVDFLQMWYYEPEEEAVKILGQLAEWKPFTNDRSIYRLILGPDGMIYGTTQAYGGTTSLLCLNPDTLEYKLFSGVGTGKRREKLTYGYYLGVDPPWAYVAVGQDEWELFAVNVETGEKRCLAERRGEGARITVSTGEVVSAELLEHGKKEVVWCVDGGILPAIVVPGQPRPYTPIGQKAYKQVEWKNTRPWPMGTPPEVDLQRVVIGADGEADVFWRPAAKSPAGTTGPTEAWRRARFAIKHAEPVPIESLALLPDGSLFGNAESYNGFFRYYPETKKLDYFGKHGPSRPQIAIVAGKAYFCGYPNTNLWEYDPQHPWTSTGKTEAGNRAVNPWLIGYFGQGTTEAHHCHFLLPGHNGRLYIGGRRERWSTGTGIGYYEFATGRKFGLPKDMTDISPQGMIILPRLGRIVVSGRCVERAKGIEGKPSEAQLRVYNLDLQEVERLTVRAGLDETGVIADIGHDSRFIGILEADARQAMYLYDLARREVVKWRDMEPPAERAVFRRPADGSFWLIRQQELCLLNPETLEIRPVARLERAMQLCRWVGEHLYGASGGELLTTAGPVPAAPR